MSLHSYDKYIVAFSGGKDSIAVFLFLIMSGVPVDKIELWHHNIDGDETTFMDWECTPDYCRKFAKSFGVKIYFQWKDGGFKGEMLRKDSLTRPIFFENEDGTIGHTGGTTGKPQTRWMFPQTSADLGVRWCSAYLKIDVCKAAIRNQPRFNNLRVMVLSGERGEESPQRAKYEVLENDVADLRNGKKFFRLVDRHRPILNWTERQVWQIIEKYRVRVHPCYFMGWGRCSCKFCIFGNKNQFASAFKVSPEIGDEIAMFERSFGKTIKKGMSIDELASLGTPYENITVDWVKIATALEYELSIIFTENEEWLLPAGAYGDGCGSF